MKKPIIGFTVLIIALAAVALVGQHWFGGHDSQPPVFARMSPDTDSSTIGPSLSAPQLPSATTPPPAPVMRGTDSPLLPLDASAVDAATSMAQAIKHGDPRAPLIVHDTMQEAATAAELADPKLYAQYEARQNMKLYRGYIKAAETEIPRLQQDIANAKAAGLKPEQIAEGEEKLRRIQQMRDQLASEHPELTR